MSSMTAEIILRAGAAHPLTHWTAPVSEGVPNRAKAASPRAAPNLGKVDEVAAADEGRELFVDHGQVRQEDAWRPNSLRKR